MRRTGAALLLILTLGSCAFRVSRQEFTILECPDGTTALTEVDGTERMGGSLDDAATVLAARVARSIVSAAVGDVLAEPSGGHRIKVVADGRLVGSFLLSGQDGDWTIGERSECR